MYVMPGMGVASADGNAAATEDTSDGSTIGGLALRRPAGRGRGRGRGRGASAAASLQSPPHNTSAGAVVSAANPELQPPSSGGAEITDDPFAGAASPPSSHEVSSAHLSPHGAGAGSPPPAHNSTAAPSPFIDQHQGDDVTVDPFADAETGGGEEVTADPFAAGAPAVAEAWGIPETFPRVQSAGNYQAAKHVEKGETPRGLSWTASTSHCQDLEDNDRSWTLELGRMSVSQSDERGRDFARELFTVSHPEHGHVSSSDGRCRDPGQNEARKQTGSSAVVRLALAEIAEHEGVSVDDVVAQLGYFAGIVAGFLQGGGDSDGRSGAESPSGGAEITDDPFA